MFQPEHITLAAGTCIILGWILTFLDRDNEAPLVRLALFALGLALSVGALTLL